MWARGFVVVIFPLLPSVVLYETTVSVVCEGVIVKSIVTLEPFL